MLLHHLLENAARRAPDRPALIADRASLSFADLRDRVASLAAGLATVAAPGDRIAVLGENRPEYVECLYGIPKAGMVCTPLNHRLHPGEWAHLLADAEASVVIGERRYLDALASHLAEAPSVRAVVGFDGGDGARLAYEDLIGGAPGELPVASLDDGDLAWLLYTSGTTGTPKGAMLTHRSLVAAMVSSSLGRPVHPGDMCLFTFPLCHVAAYNVCIHHLHARPVVLMERFDAGEFLAAIERHGVTSVTVAPTMLDMVLAHPALETADLSSLRQLAYGASPIPGPVLRAAMSRLGCDFGQGYGMTELSGNAVFLDAEAHRRAAAGDEGLLRAAGTPSPVVAVRVVDDDLRDVAVGVVGEIVVRGDQVMAGYWRNPEATAAAFAGGWFHTGDLGRWDAEGYLSVVDRKKDMIVTGGENVASREVEEVLARHPAVREVAVIGVPDERWGENVCAVVVPRDGLPVEADELVEHVRAHLAGYKKPKLVVFVDELPKSASGKILKQELRAAVRGQEGASAGSPSVSST